MQLASPIVTLPEMKAFLRIAPQSDADDAQLSEFIDAASQMWENRCGPVAGSPTYDEWYDGGSSQIILRHTPVQSVISVDESYGGAVVWQLTEQVVDAGPVGDVYGYSFERSTGILTRRATGVAIPFAGGTQNVHVVYVAGYATAPADVKQAVELLVQHMWTTQRGNSTRPGVGGQDTAPARTAFAWPNRVEEIAAAYFVPGIG